MIRVYAVQFAASEREGGESWLHFEGLKPKADVYLNGNHIASHSDADTPLAIDVSGRLRADNSLVVHFHSGKAGTEEDGRRKPAGTYLGPNPKIVSLGLFDRVFVELSDGNLLKEVVAGVSLNEALTEGTVTVDAAGTSRVSTVALGAADSNVAGAAT